MFILKEYVMSDSVKADTILVGVDTKNFNLAKEYVYKALDKFPEGVEIIVDNDLILKYSLEENRIIGYIENVQLNMLNYKGEIY
jgi:hypothetical protein